MMGGQKTTEELLNFLWIELLNFLLIELLNFESQKGAEANKKTKHLSRVPPTFLLPHLSFSFLLAASIPIYIYITWDIYIYDW
jgi:hypothetical protein